MNSRPFKLFLILNILFVMSLYVDFILPSKNTVEKFNKLESTSTAVPSGKNGRTAYEDLNLLYCKSKNVYRLFKVSPCFNNLPENQEIVIKETYILSKIKEVEIQTMMNCNKNISFLGNFYVFLFFCSALLVLLLSMFFSNTFLNILLSVSCAFIYYTSAVYLFYVE